MSLEGIMDFEECESREDEKILLIDGHNIAYITVFSTIGKNYSDNGVFKLWKHNFYNKLFTMIRDLKPTRVVLVFDVPNSWRYDLYSNYKGNRKKQYGKYPLDKEGFMVALNELIEDIRKMFTNIFVIQAPRAEGDDIMAVLAKDVFNKENEKVIVVSGDTDLNQLLSEPNISQYDPRKNEYYNVINPKKQLDIKILSGDSSDNIKPIKKGVGPKTAEKILAEGLDVYLDKFDTDIERKVVESAFDLNKKLIDLNFIPNDIKLAIIANYDNYENIPLDGKKIVKYFMKNKFTALMREWNRYSKIMKSLH